MSSTNRGAERHAHDNYPTPKWCIEAIVGRMHSGEAGLLWWGEPCAGDGVIVNTVCDILDDDPADWVTAEIRNGVDYLKGGFADTVDAIITNPPYSHWQDFVEMAERDAKVLRIFLLRLNALGGMERAAWWKRRMPSHLYILSERPCFTGDGKTDSIEYAWFVWEDTGKSIMKDKPGLHIIPPRPKEIRLAEKKQQRAALDIDAS